MSRRGLAAPADGYGSAMSSISKGAVAGAVATGAMTLHMLWAERTGRVDDLAPEHITDAGLAAAGVRPSEGEHAAATTLAHLGFGASAGALYGLVARRRAPNLALGVAYGLAIAVASYQGWVPALRILPPLSEASSGRRNEVLVSHVIYGATLAWVSGRLADDGREDGHLPQPAG